jgi:hypothetical protein
MIRSPRTTISPAFGVHDGHVRHQTLAAHGAPVGFIGKVFGPHDAHHLWRLGLAVRGLQHRTKTLAHDPDFFGGHGRAAINQVAQRREMQCLAMGLGHQHVQQRGRHEGGGDAVFAETAQQLCRLVAGRQHMAAPLRQDGQQVGRCAMGHRRRDQVPVLGMEAEGVDLVDERGLPGAVGLHHALRNTGGSPGEFDGLGFVARASVGAGRLARIGRGRSVERGVAIGGLQRQHMRHGGQVQRSEVGGLRHHHGGLGERDDAIELAGGVAPIERHPHLARRQHGEQRHHMVHRVRGTNAHPAAGLRIAVLQSTSHRVHTFRQLGIGKDLPRAHQGVALRVKASGPEKIIDRVHRNIPQYGLSSIQRGPLLKRLQMAFRASAIRYGRKLFTRCAGKRRAEVHNADLSGFGTE